MYTVLDTQNAKLRRGFFKRYLTAWKNNYFRRACNYVQTMTRIIAGPFGIEASAARDKASTKEILVLPMVDEP